MSKSLSIFIKAFYLRSDYLARLRKIHDSPEPLFLRLYPQERILFSERLALYLRSGIPIMQGLSLIKNDADRKSTSYVIGILEREVSSGKTLANALRLFPTLFDVFYLHFVEIGERSGTLAGNLAHLAVLLKRRQALRRKIQSAAIYPALVGTLTLCVTGFLTLYAFPKIIPLFRGFHAQLPFPTRALIGFSDLVTHHSLLLIVLSLSILTLTVFVVRKPYVARKIDYALVKMPVTGALAKQYFLANIFRTLATLLECGIPLVPSLALTSKGISNSYYLEAFLQIQSRVTGGQKFSAELKRHPKLFPSVVPQLISAGEITGSLSDSLRSLSEMFETEIEDTTQTLTTLIEPALMIFMGLVVGFVALAIITPIYGITQNLNLH